MQFNSFSMNLAILIASSDDNTYNHAYN